MSVTFSLSQRKFENGFDFIEPVPGCDHLDFNAANYNAVMILSLIGKDTDDLCGTLSVAEVKAAVAKLRLFDHSEPGYDTGGPGTGVAREIYFGRTRDQVLRYAAALDRLAEACTFGYTISYC